MFGNVCRVVGGTYGVVGPLFPAPNRDLEDPGFHLQSDGVSGPTRAAHWNLVLGRQQDTVSELLKAYGQPAPPIWDLEGREYLPLLCWIMRLTRGASRTNGSQPWQ